MEQEKRFALLIDADNISHKYIGIITREAQLMGSVTIRRIYGDWTDDSKASWKKVLLDNSLTPIQQYSYTIGKNSSDSAMIIDAMDILYTSPVEGFILVSSDSDFTRLASRLRESGKTIIGMGESKTPLPFRKACEQFKILDILYREKDKVKEKEKVTAVPAAPKPKNESKGVPAPERQEKTQEEVTEIVDLSEIKETILSILDENSDEDEWMYLASLGNMVQKLYSDFDCRNYGFKKFGQLVESFPELETRKEGTKKHGIKIVLVRKR